MAKHTYIVNITLTKRLKINVPASSNQEAEKAAIESVEKQIKQGKLQFDFDAYSDSIVVDKKKQYVEAILLDGHPGLCSVAEYFEDAGFFKVGEHAGYCEQFYFWLGEQPSFKLAGYEIVLVRVGNLWTAVISKGKGRTKLGAKKIEAYVAEFLSTGEKLPTGTPNPAKGAIPVAAGDADAAAHIKPTTEVVKV